MVYRGTAQRAISTTRPSIQAEEEEMKAKASAANRVLQNTQAATIPSPIPTGDAAPTAAAAQRGLVNTGPAKTAGLKSYDTGMAARGSANSGMPLTDSISASAVTGSAAGGSQMKRPPNIIRGSETAASGGDLPPVPEQGKPFEMYEIANQGGSKLLDDISKTVSTPQEQSFRDRLEETLMGKLDETPQERAQREAGRALVAARAQAGRGQMGMSGGMLALQSDVMGDAVAKAEDRLFDQQMSAGRIGTQLEALDKAERLGLLDYMETADFESQEDAINFLTNYMNIDRNTAAAAAGLIDYGSGNGGGAAPYAGPDQQPEGKIIEEFSESQIPDEVSFALDALAAPLSLFGVSTAAAARVVEMSINGEITDAESFGRALRESYSESAAMMIYNSLWPIVGGFLGN